LSYFSIFFAGFLFPLIVFLISENKEVKSHAKKALFSHLIPIIPVPFIVITAIVQTLRSPYGEPSILFFVGVGLTVILSLIVLIWNIVKGIQVLSKETL
jgi:hypothetical protein